jgi:hypothetical protein
MTEPPYFGTANEPYEPPADRSYQPPPYEPPPDRPYEPPADRPYEPPPVVPLPDKTPPVRSYQPPPDQPPPVRSYEPPPDQPPPDQPRKWRRLKIGLGAGGLLLALIAFSIPEALLSDDSSHSSDPAYGRRAVDVVHELHLCDNPTVDQGIATCTLPDGIGYALVITVVDKTEQDDLAADDKNPAEGCTMVVKGYFVTGPDRATLTQALGSLDAFAANHHGYLVGGCG